MRVRVEHLLQDKSTGRVSYRRGVPAALRPIIGRREIKRSLGVSLPPGAKSLPAAALARYTAAHEEAERLLKAAEARALGRLDTLGPKEIASVIAFDRHQQLHGHDESRHDTAGADELFAGVCAQLSPIASPQVEGGPRSRQDRRVESLDTYRAILEDAYSLGIVPDSVAEEAAELCEARGLVVDLTSSGFKALCHALVQERLQSVALQLDRESGKVVETPSPLPDPVPQTPAISVSKAFERAKEVEVHTASTGMAWDTAERYFVALHGDIDLSSIERSHAVSFKDALRRLPAGMSAKERQRALTNKLDAGALDRPALAAKTINTHLSVLHKVWSWAADHDLMDDARVARGNPFDRLSLRQAARAAGRGAGAEYTDEQLQTIFSLPVFSQGARPKRGRGDAAYWIPILALFTGARREELAMLIGSDINRDVRSGRWRMTIGDRALHPVKGERDTKTHISRTIPVHPELIRLGFIDFARRAGKKPLFPALTVTNARRQLGAKWGEWWSKYIREAGVAIRQPVHAFRHTWTTAARASGVPKDAREFIQGHSGGGSMNDAYGDLSVLGEHLDKVSYPGLDLSSLYVEGAVERAAAKD